MATSLFDLAICGSNPNLDGFDDWSSSHVEGLPTLAAAKAALIDYAAAPPANHWSVPFVAIIEHRDGSPVAVHRVICPSVYDARRADAANAKDEADYYDLCRSEAAHLAGPY